MDVNEFQQGLERTVNQLTRLESEMKQIESAVQGLTQLEESLKGQGGEALRAYYESCHLPFLTFFNTFKNSFTSVLQEMKTALSSLEPDSSGFIRQAALEGEIEQGLNRAKQVTEELTDEANNIMDQVSDIVNLPKLDDSEVHLGVHDAKRHRDETVEKLIEFDVSQTDALTTIQTDLMHMKTWITNIETMMTEGVTDVNFPAEQWQSFASQNPLMIALAYRTQSLDQVINMNPLFNPGGIGGANPYTLPGLYQNGQQPLVTFGLSGAMVSTNFVSFMKQKEKEIVKELSTTATTVDNVKDEGNGFLNFLGDVGSGATKVGKGLLDFLILDDVNTLADKNASGLDKGIALASFIPVGKVLKIPKAIDKIVDSNVGEVVKKSDVDEVVGKGNGTSQVSGDIIKDGSHLNKGGRLKPNVKYHAGEYNYLYKTDELGRITDFNADDLKLTKRDNRLPHKPNTPGKEPGDHAGHLAADRFGGSPDLDNLVSQSSSVNLSKYKKLENQWAKAIEEGKDVSVNVKVNYEGNSLRPSGFDIEYEIDGRMRFTSIEN
ncbi:Transposase protein [Solibacillus isronensis B3W22]|uniref:Transposase protein n=1 Tax=Solibacillus isronensis B3W22 TaxID=1224748 RepID=K1LNU2_9BACL|nr:Transposase protein [Solibacillus isronensis B3W22]